MYVLLPSVIVDIVGQNYKNDAKVKDQKVPLYVHSIHLGEKYLAHVVKKSSLFLKFSKLLVWSINDTFQPNEQI